MSTPTVRFISYATQDTGADMAASQSSGMVCFSAIEWQGAEEPAAPPSAYGLYLNVEDGPLIDSSPERVNENFLLLDALEAEDAPSSTGGNLEG